MNSNGLKTKNIMEIFERLFDNPNKKDGTPKENKKLGDFEIVKTIREDIYTSTRIGKMNNKTYLIEEYEVCGFNGGSEFTITEMNES